MIAHLFCVEIFCLCIKDLQISPLFVWCLFKYTVTSLDYSVKVTLLFEEMPFSSPSFVDQIVTITHHDRQTVWKKCCCFFSHWLKSTFSIPCPVGEESCSSAEWQCSSGQCLSVGMRCDGHPDCRDHSDEENCSKPPPCSTKRRCPKSQECLLDEWMCDGEMDCKDGTDEKVCVTRPKTIY